MKPRDSAERWTYIVAAIGVGAAAVNLILGAWLIAYCLLLLVWFLLTSAYARRRAFLSGWLHGRADMIALLQEANQRDLSAQEFLAAVMEKDACVMIDQMGQREFKRFSAAIEAEAAKRAAIKDEMAKRVAAASDGSHDEL